MIAEHHRLSTPGLRVGAVAAAVALTLGAVAAILGWAAGRATAPSPPQRAASTLAIAGPAHVSLPSNWVPGQATATGIRGIDPKTTAVFSLFAGLRAHGLVMFGQPDDPSLIPSVLRETLARTPGEPRTGLLAGRRAWLYAGVPLTVRDNLIDVTVVPTTAGVLTIACVASPSVWAAASGCASDVQQITVDGASPVPPAEMSSQWRLLVALTQLEGARATARKRLQAATTPRAQARVARRVGAAYGSAVTAVAPHADGSQAETIVSLLRQTGEGYERLAAAATAGQGRKYDAARAAIRKSEAALADALAQLQRN
jgi:hypothetical protein